MADWVIHGTGVTVTANTTDLQAPNATSSATKVERGNSEAYIFRVNELTCEAGDAYTVSLTVKLDGVERAVLRVGESADDNFVEATYDLVNNTIVDGPKKKGDNVSSNYEARIVALGDSWFTCLLQIEFDIDTDLNIYFTTRDGNVGLKGADTDSLDHVSYFWNPKVEKRSIDPGIGYLGSANTSIMNVPKKTYFWVPVWGSDTNVITYKKPSDGTLRHITPTTLNDHDTTTAIEYLRIPANRVDGFPEDITVQDTQGRNKVIKFDRDDFYSKMEPHLITYVNKRGAMEAIWFIRKSEYTMNTKSDKYYKNLIDYDTMTYNQHDHSMKKYNVVSHKSVTLNTSLISDSMNPMFEELKQSEQVWMTNNSGTFPVNLKDGSFKFKNHPMDKLVQYSMTFDFANRVDNTIV